MKFAVCSLAIVTTLGAFGLRTLASAGAPAWCGDAGGKTQWPAVEGAITGDDPRNAIKDIVGEMCKPDGEAQQRMKEIEASRQKWMKRLEMSEADWSDAVEYATLGQGERMNGEISINTNGQKMGIGDTLKRPWSTFDAIDQWVMARSDAGASNDLSLDHDYFIDSLGDHLTETGRLAYVMKCISTDNPVRWAMCQGDIAALDLKKVGDELRANKAYPGADKMRIRIELLGLKPKLEAHAADVKKLIAKDPGYGKLFDVATAQRKEWDGRRKADAALLDLVSAMDDARATNSRKAFAGCEDKTWTAWKGTMATVPAKKFEHMQDDRENGKSFVDAAMGPIIDNPSVYLASVALTTCMGIGQDRNAPHDVLVRLLGDAMERWPGFRGPRTATESMIMTSGVTLDDRDAKLDYPSVSRTFGVNGGGSRSGGGSGVVASIKPAGKTTTVEFKKQMVKQVQCAEVKYTNHVTQIRGDGTLVYEANCMRNETVMVDKSSGPQKVNPRYLDGVKPGMAVSIIEDVVVAAWAKPGAATPSMVFGVAVK